MSFCFVHCLAKFCFFCLACNFQSVNLCKQLGVHHPMQWEWCPCYVNVKKDHNPPSYLSLIQVNQYWESTINYWSKIKYGILFVGMDIVRALKKPVANLAWSTIHYARSLIFALNIINTRMTTVIQTKKWNFSSDF